MSTNAPIESKVYAALIGGTVGTAATNLVLWLVGAFLFGGPRDAVSNAAAIAEVPDAVATALRHAITLGCIGLAGYYAKHTPRALEAGQVVEITAPVKVLSNNLPSVPHAEHLLSPKAQRVLASEKEIAANTVVVEDDGLADETETK